MRRSRFRTGLPRGCCTFGEETQAASRLAAGRTAHSVTFRSCCGPTICSSSITRESFLYGHRSGERAQAVSPRNPAAREFLRGSIEVLLTRQVSEDPNEWECLVRPGRKIGVGEKLYFGDPAGRGRSHDDRDLSLWDRDPHANGLQAEVTWRGTFGERRIRFLPVPDFFARVERLGHVPLPPYIDREDSPADRDRYQTVYAKARGSAAAAPVVEAAPAEARTEKRGKRVEKVEEHTLHRESYEISASAAAAINQAKSQGRRIVAVGTTTVRTLEYAAGAGRANPAPTAPCIEPGSGEADIFIYPGYRFRMVDALLTNFHLPQSTLLMLVCALGGTDLVLRAYGHAVSAGYRFYSYGDCMFVE